MGSGPRGREAGTRHSVCGNRGDSRRRETSRRCGPGAPGLQYALVSGGHMADKITTTLPNKLEYVPVAVASVWKIADILGFTVDEAEQLMLAVREAATNVTEHA